jgi:hypothetical protein
MGQACGCDAQSEGLRYFAYSYFRTYRAQKFVSVKSTKIALIYRGLQAAVMIYILVITILMNNKHLLPVRMDGSVRMTMQQPTDGCNPMHAGCASDYMSMSALPYCSVYQPNHDAGVKPMSFVPWSTARHADVAALKSKGLQHDCVYKDNINLTFSFPVPGALFLQTRASMLPQFQQCTPNITNNHSCRGALFKMTSNNAQQNYYVAEIERFTLMFDHGYRAQLPNQEKEIFGHAHQYKGFVQNWDGKREPIPSAGQFFRKKQRSKAYPSLFTIKSGNIISVADILNLADKRGEKVMDVVDDKLDGKTRRWNGGVLHVTVHYDGEHKWNPLGTTKITYVMSAELLPQTEFKNMYALGVNGGQRMVHDEHGFLVLATVHGTDYVFDLVYLFQVLTTSVAMLAFSKYMVDLCMNGCLPESKHYRALQVQSSINFDDVDEEDYLRDQDSRAYHQLKVGNAHDKTAAYMTQRAAAQQKGLDGTDLTYVLLKFEQRLNSIDGLDPTFVCGRPPKEDPDSKAYIFKKMTDDKAKDFNLASNKTVQS